MRASSFLQAETGYFWLREVLDLPSTVSSGSATLCCALEGSKSWVGFRAGHWSWREKLPFFLEWRPEWQIFTLEENRLFLSDSYTLSDPQLPQLLEPQGLEQDETKNWKLLRGMKNTQPIMLTSVGLNLTFLSWKVFHLYKLICCPHIKKH